MPDIGLITCRRLPEPDPDHELLSSALADAGIAAGLIPWDDDASRPSDYKLCVFRSCWNYFEDIDAFLRWVGHTERVVSLANSAEVVRWNIHKRYLRSPRGGRHSDGSDGLRMEGAEDGPASNPREGRLGRHRPQTRHFRQFVPNRTIPARGRSTRPNASSTGC